MTASRAPFQLGTARGGVEFVAANAVEGRLAPFAFERAMIPPIVPKPEGEEDDRDNEAVNDGRDGKIEHRNSDRLKRRETFRH